MCLGLSGEVLALSIAWIFLVRAFLSWAVGRGEWGLSGFMEVLVSLDAPEQARRGWFIGMVYRSFGLSLVCIPLSEGAATGKILVNFCNSETSKIALPLCELAW